MTAQRGPTAAPCYLLADGAWIPYALTWDPETGEMRGVEGPRGFATYREVVEASRFLARHHIVAARHPPRDRTRALRLPTEGLMHSDTAHRGRLLYVALGFLGLDLPPAAMPPGLRALHAWLDTWHGTGLIDRARHRLADDAVWALCNGCVPSAAPGAELACRFRRRSSDPAFAWPSPQISGAKSTTPRTAKDTQLGAPVYRCTASISPAARPGFDSAGSR